MNTLQLDIEGGIGAGGYSKSYVKNFFAAAGKGPVTIKVSSFGGDIDHAISIHDQIIEHGEVTILLSSFNASAGTLITLGAKHITMNSNGFYLIHKALSWIDTWGNMNPDDIDALIESLQKDKKDLETVTLVLAKMYAKKSKKTTTEILNLMKEETWLNAEQALAWGFVDEIVEPARKENLLQNQRLVTMLNYSELPIPGTLMQTEDPTPGIIATVTSSMKKIINSIFTMKQLAFLNKLLGVPSLEASDEGVYLNEAQLAAINEALEANQQIVTERDAAIVNRDAAVTDRTNMVASLDAIDASIATATTIETKIQAIRDFMAAKPAVAPVGVVTAVDPITDTLTDNIKLLNSLPHMQEDN